MLWPGRGYCRYDGDRDLGMMGTGNGVGRSAEVFLTQDRPLPVGSGCVMGYRSELFVCLGFLHGLLGEVTY